MSTVETLHKVVDNLPEEARIELMRYIVLTTTVFYHRSLKMSKRIPTRYWEGYCYNVTPDINKTQKRLFPLKNQAADYEKNMAGNNGFTIVLTVEADTDKEAIIDWYENKPIWPGA